VQFLQNDVVDMATLIDAASFTPESLQPPSAWLGHLPLAAWVIRQVGPETFVELGTHTGNSYFAFCQSVLESGLSTKCYAVDTWRGDEQAGLYDETVFAEVNAHNQRRYPAFSRLLRMTFDEALDQFSDESIDLLHIDGLHTYEAVRHDFEAWLPKLAPGAIVMFHDTAVREGDFGVWKLWEELQERYPHNIEFSHSHGLGVLQLNNARDARRQKWLGLDRSEKNKIQTYFAALGSRQLERFALNAELSTSKQEVAARDVHIANLGRAADERDAQIASLRQHASNLDAIIADLKQHASNLERELSRRDAHIANLDRVIADRDLQNADLRQAVANLDAVIVDLRFRGSDLAQELLVRGAAFANLTQALAERDDLIANLSRDVNAIRHSTSWRLTAPLRWLAHGLRKARHEVPATRQ
jgi:hypothetical protein